ASGGLIASNASEPFRRSSSEPKRTATTTLPAERSARTVIRLAGMPSGGPSAELISLTIASMAASSASNVTTREYSAIPSSFVGGVRLEHSVNRDSTDVGTLATA